MKPLLRPLPSNLTSPNPHHSPGQLDSHVPLKVRSLHPASGSGGSSKFPAKSHKHHICKRHQKSHMLHDYTYVTLRDRQDHRCKQKSEEQLPLEWGMQGRGQEGWSLYCFLIWMLVTCVCNWQKFTELGACYVPITFTHTHTQTKATKLCASVSPFVKWDLLGRQSCVLLRSLFVLFLPRSPALNSIPLHLKVMNQISILGATPGLCLR